MEYTEYRKFDTTEIFTLSRKKLFLTENFKKFLRWRDGRVLYQWCARRESKFILFVKNVEKAWLSKASHTRSLMSRYFIQGLLGYRHARLNLNRLFLAISQRHVFLYFPRTASAWHVAIFKIECLLISIHFSNIVCSCSSAGGGQIVFFASYHG